MKNVGYAHLHEHLALGVLPPRCPARVRPVTPLMRLEEELAVPPERSLADDDLLSHLLFALKHEGVDLAILAETLPHLPVESLVASLKASPNSIYLRRRPFSTRPSWAFCRLNPRYGATPCRCSIPSAT